MGKYKYLLKNIGVLTLSNFATKLLSFLLVPLYGQYILGKPANGLGNRAIYQPAAS